MTKPTILNEDVLQKELYSLIRFLYRKLLAEDIIQDFETVLARHSEAEERRQIILHWIDFLRAHKYRKLMRRRRPTQKERMTACAACGYPVSHRHHLWDIATHGENSMTVQVCANCHELYHTVYNVLARDSVYSQKIVLHILASGRVPLDVVSKILAWCRGTMGYEVANGWLDDYKTSDDWLELKLYWSKFANGNQETV